jgi:dimethylglycine dehydrogenase
MNALRMEKGFKGAGELTNELTLPEADVMRFVALGKDFIGADATRVSAASASQPWTCAYLAIEADGINDDHGGEAVYLDGKVAGAARSALVLGAPAYDTDNIKPRTDQ